MFAGSFSMVVGLMSGGGDVTVDMGGMVEVDALGEEFAEAPVRLERADRGAAELEGLVLAVVGRAGPITCRKCMNRG